jgi:hypothetical protein
VRGSRHPGSQSRPDGAAHSMTSPSATPPPSPANCSWAEGFVKQPSRLIRSYYVADQMEPSRKVIKSARCWRRIGVNWPGPWRRAAKASRLRPSPLVALHAPVRGRPRALRREVQVGGDTVETFNQFRAAQSAEAGVRDIAESATATRQQHLDKKRHVVSTAVNRRCEDPAANRVGAFVREAAGGSFSSPPCRHGLANWSPSLLKSFAVLG